MAHRRDYSEKTAEAIDDEIKRMITEAAERADELLRANLDTMHRMAEALLEFEVLDDPQLDKLMAGERLEKVDIEENGRASAPEEADKESVEGETDSDNDGEPSEETG